MEYTPKIAEKIVGGTITSVTLENLKKILDKHGFCVVGLRDGRLVTVTELACYNSSRDDLNCKIAFEQYIGCDHDPRLNPQKTWWYNQKQNLGCIPFDWNRDFEATSMDIVELCEDLTIFKKNKLDN